MTYEQEILARAMSCIDDDMILAAHAPRKKIRRVIPVAIAACLIAAFAVAFPTLREVINTKSDLLSSEDDLLNKENAGSASKEEITCIAQNVPVTLGGSTLTLLDTTETTATFKLEKTDNTPVYAHLYDRRDGVLAATESGYTDNGVVIRPNTLRLYVNGADEPVYQLPTAPGSYEITIDFTSIRNGTYPMQECIGLYAYIGEDDAAVTHRFSLATVAVTEDTVTDSVTDSITDSVEDTIAETTATP